MGAAPNAPNIRGGRRRAPAGGALTFPLVSSSQTRVTAGKNAHRYKHETHMCVFCSRASPRKAAHKHTHVASQRIAAAIAHCQDVHCHPAPADLVKDVVRLTMCASRPLTGSGRAGSAVVFDRARSIAAAPPLTARSRVEGTSASRWFADLGMLCSDRLWWLGAVPRRRR